MQTADNTPSELPPEAAVSSPSPTQGGSLDFGLVSDQDVDIESDAEAMETEGSRLVLLAPPLTRAPGRGSTLTSVYLR